MTERSFDVYAEVDPARGTRHVLLRCTADGALVLDGQDLGGGVSSVFGDDLREYEWTFTVAPERVNALLDALAIAPGSDAAARVADRLRTMEPAAMQEAFRRAGAEFWSRVGD